MTIEDDIAFFERVPTLGQLGRDALRILAIGAESRYVHDGEVLFAAGDDADAGYVIQEGSFSLSTGHAEETEPLVVGRGALIGEIALLTETTRPATATAREPSTVLRIPRGLFLKMLDGYPSAAEKLRDILATRSNQSAADIYAVRGILDGRDPS
ncbi:MAG TPA: cyclic nucleotide-binding domain-containing protein [Xanthobacteraceae bacterium]